MRKNWEPMRIFLNHGNTRFVTVISMHANKLVYKTRFLCDEHFTGIFRLNIESVIYGRPYPCIKMSNTVAVTKFSFPIEFVTPKPNLNSVVKFHL